MIKVSKDFYITEFVPKEIYDQFQDKSTWFINPVIVAVAQFMRDRYNKSILINNWFDNGHFNYRGFRPITYEFGGKLSQHRMGNAIDLNVTGMTPDETRADIMANQKLFFDAGLRCIENGADSPSWLHADCRNTMLTGEIIIVNA